MKPNTRFTFSSVWHPFIIASLFFLFLPVSAASTGIDRAAFDFDSRSAALSSCESYITRQTSGDIADYPHAYGCEEQTYPDGSGMFRLVRLQNWVSNPPANTYGYPPPSEPPEPEVPECPDPGTPAGTFSITTSGPSPQSRCDGSCMLTNAGGVGIGTDNPDGSISWTVAMNFTGESCSMSGDPLEPTIPPSDTGNEEPGDPTPPCYTDVSTPNTTDCIFVDDDGTQTPPGEHGDGEGEDGDGDGEDGDGDNGEGDGGNDGGSGGEGGEGDGTDYGGKLDAILDAITNGTGDLKDAISNIPGGGGGGNNSGGDGGESGDDDEQNDVSWSGDEIDLSLDDTDEEYQQVMADYQQKIQDIKNDVQSMFGTNLNGGGAVPDDTSIIKGVEVNFSLNRWLPDFSILGAVILFCAAFISAGILFNGKG